MPLPQSFKDREKICGLPLTRIDDNSREEVSAELEDWVLWKKTKNGIFSVKSLYSAVELGNAVRFLRKIIWSPYVPPKVGFFFAWEASKGKVLTLDQLKKRGLTLANRCFFCLIEEESTNHILIHCTKTRVLWELLFALFGVIWVLPCSVREALLGWYPLLARNAKKLGSWLLYVFFGRCGRKET